MVVWFASLKKETKIIVVIGVIALLIIGYFGIKTAYWKYQYFKGIETEFKQIEKDNKQLKKDLEVLDIERKKISDKLDKQNLKIDSLLNVAKKYKDEANKIPPIVRTYPDRKLDSILTNHRHISRSED